MSPEIQNLLLGATIALIASLITSWVNNKHQQNRDEKARKWELEDRLSQRERDLFDKRATAVENGLNELITAIQKYVTAVGFLMQGSEEQGRGLLVESTLADLSSQQGLSILTTMGDPYLSQDIEKIKSIYDQILDIGFSSYPASRRDDVYKQLTTLKNEALTIKTSMLEKLDEISIKY
jgi:hypothetical protein